MQFYKGDEFELKFYNSGQPIAETLSGQKSDFFAGCYSCYVLGELIHDSKLAPLVRAIPREIFRESFAALFQSFQFAGTFESYMSVFRSIFGDSVVVEFTVPAPGKLTIDVTAEGLAIYNFIVRTIVGNAYVFDNLVDRDGDQIVFRSVKGFETEYELKQMLFEMVPGGIWTQISLTVGGA